MARKQHHEDHVNHEAWAIPYGDLVTLLLAFFVVMYAVSSVNEGKYRVLSASMQAAFSGLPKSLSPVQIGEHQAMQRTMDPNAAALGGTPMIEMPNDVPDLDGVQKFEKDAGKSDTEGAGVDENDDNQALMTMAASMEIVLAPLIGDDLISVTLAGTTVEVEMKTDILFPIGSADIQSDAASILKDVASVLAPLKNSFRVEGHTDSIPISNARYPSNWELSAARAARIVREFEALGIDASRMIVVGMGEHNPVAANDNSDGRHKNRRVTLVVMNEIDKTNIDELAAAEVDSIKHKIAATAAISDPVLAETDEPDSSPEATP